MNKIVFRYISLMIMSVNIYGVSSASNFTYEGQVRVGYQSHTINKDKQEELAIGAKLHLESPLYYGLQVGTTIIGTFGNGKNDFYGVPFFDENNENYSSISESYIKYTNENTTFILGRQILDTPFADSDDIGMVPNTFQALTLTNTTLRDTTLFFSHVQQWSGVDSDIQSKFTKINNNNGMQILGLNYEGLENTTLSGWFYNLKNEADIAYFDADYLKETQKFAYGIQLQFAYQNYENNTHSSIYGAAFSFGIKKIGLTTTLSYNKSYGIAAENFFGGGPFFTNVEHNTLKEAGPDGKTLLYTMEWDASVIGIEGLILTTSIDAHLGNKYNVKEYDIGIDYSYNNRLNIAVIYSDIEDRDESFQNLRIFSNYTF